MEKSDAILVELCEASAAQRSTVRELIERVGAELLFLLPYSPDYSPIGPD